MQINSYQPAIVAFVSDLLIRTRINFVATSTGYIIHWVGDSDQISPNELQYPYRQYGEPLFGVEGKLIEMISERKPALVIFDLDNSTVPWEKWIPLIKSVPATRRVNVICFSSQMDVNSLKIARDYGADGVYSRFQFISGIEEIIKKHSSVPDFEGIRISCQSPLSEIAIQGLEYFNRGEYFEAHEFLEEAWNEDPTPGREMYRAILQVAVAYLQIQRNNYNGAIKMFLRLRQWIKPLPDICRGVNIAQLKEDARIVEEHLVQLGREHISEFDLHLFKPVRYSTKIDD